MFAFCLVDIAVVLCYFYTNFFLYGSFELLFKRTIKLCETVSHNEYFLTNESDVFKVGDFKFLTNVQ